MSRTIRRKNAYKPWWLLSTWESNGYGFWSRCPRPEKEAIKVMAVYHSDKDQHNNASSWFRTQEHKKNENFSKRGTRPILERS
jgi:hypothetical protein